MINIDVAVGGVHEHSDFTCGNPISKVIRVSIGPIMHIFLMYLSRKKGGSSFYRNSYTGIGGGSSGGTSYVIGKDWSVITN